MMKPQTLLASVVSAFLLFTPVVKADDAAPKAEKAAKKDKHTSCECGDCKKGKCAKKKCEHCEHHEGKGAGHEHEEEKKQ